MFAHPAEFYRDLQTENVRKALGWHEGTRITKIFIPEADLESHFEAVWGEDGEEYRQAIERWRGDGPLTDLAVLTFEATGDRSYVVDTSDLVIGKPGDEFFFYMVATCWAVVADIDAGDKGELRVAFHLPGITVNKDFSLGELVKVLGEKARLTKLTIFYNSKKNDTAPESKVKHILPEGLSTKYVDMNELDTAGVHDLFIRGGRATQFYNHGVFDEETETARVWRLRSGEWKV